MIETLIHTTERNNSYIYDDQTRLSMLIHPELKKAHDSSVDGWSYYSKKYDYLTKHGFFGRPKVVSFEHMSDDTIKQSIQQLSSVVFEVTDACNLQCKYCGYGELYDGYETRNHKNIDTVNAKKLLRLIHGNKNSKLTVAFYGGEPLLNMAFIKEIVGYVNELNFEKKTEVEYTITTNGTLVHKHIGFLVAHNFLLTFSLDGNEENHSYRIYKNKRNSFGKVIENIDMVQKDYPEYFANRVNINSVLHDRNSAKDIYEFIYTRYHIVPEISELALDDIREEKREILTKMFRDRRNSEREYQEEESVLLHVGNSAASIDLGVFVNHYSVNYYVSHLPHLFNDEEKYFPTSTCVPFSRTMFLTNRNKLLFCQTINYKYSTGNIGEDIIIDIPEITRKYNYYYKHLEKMCRHCYAYRYCGKCMFQFNDLDKVETEECVCDSFQNKIQFENRLLRIFSFLERHPGELSHIIEDYFTQE